MRKQLGTFVLMTVVLSMWPSPARAGGSWIEFPGDRILIGATVTGVGHFGNGQQAPVSAGPWFAILRPDDAGVGPIELGPVTIGESNVYGWKATVTFTVPDVPPGEYWVDVVNAQGDGVGDLIGGFVLVAHTPLEARLWRDADRAKAQLEQRDRALGRAQELEDQLRADLADRDATIDRQAERLADVGAQAALMEADLTQRRADEAIGGPMWPTVLIGAGIIALAAAAFALGRRSLRDADAGDGSEPLVNGEPRRAGIG